MLLEIAWLKWLVYAVGDDQIGVISISTSNTGHLYILWPFRLLFWPFCAVEEQLLVLCYLLLNLTVFPVPLPLCPLEATLLSFSSKGRTWKFNFPRSEST